MPRKEQTNEYSLQEDDRPRVNQYPGGIEPKDPMIVEEHQGEIRIKPYTLRCNFCGTTEDVHEFHGKGICEACATKAFEKLGGQ